MGPGLCWAAQAPGRGDVDSDMCLHTGFLVTAEAALAFHAVPGVCADSRGLHLNLELV